MRIASKLLSDTILLQLSSVHKGRTHESQAGFRAGLELCGLRSLYIENVIIWTYINIKSMCIDSGQSESRPGMKIVGKKEERKRISVQSLPHMSILPFSCPRRRPSIDIHDSSYHWIVAG